MNSESFVSRVIALIRERGQASSAEMLVAFPGTTRNQLKHALQNARNADLVKLLRRHVTGTRGSSSLWAPSDGSNPKARPSQARTPKPVSRRVVASVFDMADDRVFYGKWPPAMPTSATHVLQGDWE